MIDKKLIKLRVPDNVCAMVLTIVKKGKHWNEMQISTEIIDTNDLSQNGLEVEIDD